MLNNPLRCSYDGVATSLCIERNCPLEAFMCENGRCQCKKPHRYHAIMKMEELFKRIQSSPSLPRELQEAQRELNMLLSIITSTVEDVRKAFREYFEPLIGRESRSDILRRKLIAREPLRGDESKSDSISRMLAQLSERKEIPALHLASKRDLQELTSQIDRRMKAINYEIKKCYGLTKEVRNFEEERRISAREKELFKGDVITIGSSFEGSVQQIVEEITRQKLFQKYPALILLPAEESDHLYPRVKKLAEEIAMALRKQVEQTTKTSRCLRVYQAIPKRREPIVEIRPPIPVRVQEIPVRVPDVPVRVPEVAVRVQEVPVRVQEVPVRVELALEKPRKVRDYIELHENIIKVTPDLVVSDAINETIRKWNSIIKDFNGVGIQYNSQSLLKAEELINEFQKGGFHEINRRQKGQNTVITMFKSMEKEVIPVRVEEQPRRKPAPRNNYRN